MIRQSILFALLLAASLQLGAQMPRNITIRGESGALRVVPCTDNDAGNINFDVNNFVGQSNDISLDTIYLCLGDTLPVLHIGDFTLNGDPNMATPAGVAYAFYDCRPTVDGPDLATVLADPCVNQANPIIFDGVSIPQTDGIWVAVDDNMGNVALTNTGFHQEAFNMGNPAPIQLWFAPITVDNLALLAYENGGPCVSVSVDQAFSVVYLEAVEVTEVFPNFGPGMQGAFSVGGGLPEFEPGTTYDPITISHLGGDVLAGTVQTPNPGHGDTVRFTVPRPGEYEVVVEDGKSCAAIDTIVMPVIFSAGAANGAPGDTVCVEIRVDNLVDVTNAQFTLNWDPAILDFVEVNNLNTTLPALDDGAFNTNPAVTDLGRLPFAWADFFGASNSLPDGSVLFEACFEVIGTLGDISDITFGNVPTPIQVGNINNSPSMYPFETAPGRVNVTNSVLLVTTSQDSVSCSGLADGSFTVTVSGGVGPYNFTWNTFPPTGPENGPLTIANSGGSATVGGRLAGDYRVIVTDSDMPANIDTVFVEVLQGPSLGVSLLTTEPTCFSQSTGSVTAQVTLGGVVQPNPGANFNFTWNNNPNNIPTLANLPSGFYAVTVTDGAGCTASASTTLSQPAQLQILGANTTITDATCSGAMDGSILVGATGGTSASGSYTYAWSGGLGTITANTSQVSNLDPGNYTVTVTDDNNCMLEGGYAVSAAKILLVNLINLQDVSCNGADDGLIEVSGTTTGQPPAGPFTYDWATVPPSGPTFAGAQVTGLGPAQYAVTVTDSDPAGCSVSDTFAIAEPAPLAIQQIELLNESCANGGGDGSITIGVTGGTYPYTYNWTGGQVDSIAVNLTEGMYTVDVSDANNCTANQTFNITAPTPPQVTQLNNDTLACFNDTNGSLSVLATPGGAPIQSYNWSNSATGQTIANLPPGSYFVTITAADGCFTVDTALVVAPEPLALDSLVAGAPNCPGDDNGSLTVFVSGGTTPYTYIWNNQPANDTTQFNLYPGLTAGAYEVSVFDANGCGPLMALGTVEDPAGIVVDFSNIADVSCFEGVCDGSATATAMYSDGTAGVFDFTWGSGETSLDVMSSTATALCKDKQAVAVQDANGCSISDTVLIGSPPRITASFSISNVSCNGLSDGTATVMASGGTPGYTYLWQETGEATATISGLTAGFYNAVITDANSCQFQLEATVTQPNQLVISVNADETEDVSCFGAEDGVLVVSYDFEDTTLNQVGPEPYTWSSNVPPGSTSPLGVATNLPAGTYGVTITDLKGCQDSLMYTLVEPTEIMASIPDPADPPCFNSTTKVNIDTVFGGAGASLADYQYMVDGNGILLPINVPADIFGDGAHDVEVFDLNGCSALFQVDIDQPEEILVTFPEDPFVVELGDTTRQLQPIITPLSTQVDSFIWSPEEYLSDPTVRNPFVRPLQSLEYELTVVDVNGCEGIGSVFVELDANRNIYIPNVFSPNGDGVNDEFRVYPCVGVSRITSVNIFNRWGDLVYQSDGQDVSNGLYCIGGLPLWDGRHKGSDMKPDVFVYVIEVEFLDKIKLAYRGDVSILR
ncbi:MAG: gliding motility-associated C-terminal domain-containing protein [Lewinellaceae bacterium]|nr:gliding motility-associated C-terminal domain-containing protein [Phaeodactylibacter sp.]MCB9039835.1 gliding motility-associated C-terminal domain-containing protein [Lewinellaceae bacterium]